MGRDSMSLGRDSMQSDSTDSQRAPPVKTCAAWPLLGIEPLQTAKAWARPQRGVEIEGDAVREHVVADFKLQWRGPWLADCAKERDPSSERLARQVKPAALMPHGIARRRFKQPGQRSKRAMPRPTPIAKPRTLSAEPCLAPISPLERRRVKKIGCRLITHSVENACRACAQGPRTPHRKFAFPLSLVELLGLVYLLTVFTS